MTEQAGAGSCFAGPFPDEQVRPRSLSEFIGHEDLRANLHVYLQAARERGQALDHTLFHGNPGLGSGWLCRHAQPGDAIALRIRRNPNFHPPAADVPMILIGNGTGLAGLRAHLKARALAGATRNWLLFGERHRAHDAFLADELAAWQAQGLLPHLDLTFSRDGDAHRYVQHALASHANRLRQWVEEGAAVYVCGSLAGMAPDVDATLRRILGEDKVEALRIAGRYRRDVY